MKQVFTRRRILQYGLLGSLSLGLSSACSEFSPFNNPIRQTKRLSSDHISLIIKLAPSVIGISRCSFEPIQAAYLQQLEAIHDKLPPLNQEGLSDILTLLNFFGFRWCYGIFSAWEACSDNDAKVFMQQLSESKMTFIQIVYQNFVSFITSSYYALPERWQEIHFPPNIIIEGLYE